MDFKLLISLKLDIKCLRNCWGVGDEGIASFCVYFLAMMSKHHGDVCGQEGPQLCPGSIPQSWLLFPEVIPGVELLVLFPMRCQIWES